MPALKVLIIAFSFFVFGGELALANTQWGACHGRGDLQILPEAAEVEVFAKNLENQFTEVFALSRAELKMNVDCLTGDDGSGRPDPSQTCSERIRYFQESLPVVWKKYRQALALSRFSQKYLRQGKGLPFNSELHPPNWSWFVRSQPQPLSPDELIVAEQTWLKQLGIVFRGVARDIEKTPKPHHFNPQDSMYRNQARQILLSGNSDEVFGYTRNPWIKWARQQVERRIFKLNRKRLIHLVVKHPLLALLSEVNLSQTHLVASLDKMKTNLISSNAKIHQDFQNYFTQAALPPGPGEAEALYATGGHHGISETGLHPFLDYRWVVESLLTADPESCRVAEFLQRQRNNSDMWKTGLTLAGGLAAFAIGGPVVGAGYIVGIQIYSIHSTAKERERTIEEAFANAQKDLNLKSGKDAYLVTEELVTEVAITPMLLVGVPLFRFSRLLKVLR